jgi:predicted aspartyl protease
MPGPFPYHNGYGATLAPACEITLSWQGRTVTIPALVDSGASGTLIPQSAAKTLRLQKVGERRASGAYGKPQQTPLYRVNIDFLGFVFPDHPVTEFDSNRQFALIGRDILNRYQTLLNGPASEFSIR